MRQMTPPGDVDHDFLARPEPRRIVLVM